MGILNLTPDSFFDGGQFNAIDKALTRVEKMLLEGVDIIDVGGESTRPGATKISLQEEIKRVEDVVFKISQKFPEAFLSIDSYKPEAALTAIDAGCKMINCVLPSSEMAKVAATKNVYYCLMHNRQQPIEKRFVETLIDEIKERVDEALNFGVKSDKIIIDPGFGFGFKSVEQNFECIEKLPMLKQLGYPILVGVSNKSSVAAVVKNREVGTLALNTIAAYNGANILRVHDVSAHKDMIRTIKSCKSK